MVREAAGHGEAARVERRDAERVAREVQRAAEARVEVEMRGVVDADAGAARAPSTPPPPSPASATSRDARRRAPDRSRSTSRAGRRAGRAGRRARRRARASRRARPRPCRRPSPRPCTSCTGSRPCGCRAAPWRGRRPSARPGTRRRGSSAAIAVIGAIISRDARRGTARDRCRGAPRRAFSKIANVSHAWKTSCATSTGSGGDSHGNGRLLGRLERVRRALAALLVRAAASRALPRSTISARSCSPASIRVAVAFTSCWPIVPPMPE